MICEASRGLVVIPVIVKPIPVQHHLVTVHVEIRDVEVATIAVPHKL